MTHPKNTKHLLMIGFVVIFLMSNWFDAKIVLINGHMLDAGTLIFPFTFMINSILTESFGYHYAKYAVMLGILFNLIFLLFGIAIYMMPIPNESINADFDTIMALNTQIIVASIFSYGCAELCNSKLTNYLKISHTNTHMAIRHAMALSAATLCDSIIFSVIAFYNILNLQQLTNLILSMWFIKIAIQLLLVPLSSQISKKLLENIKY